MGTPPGQAEADVTDETAPPEVGERPEFLRARRTAVRLVDGRSGDVKRTLAEDDLKKTLWQQVAFSPDGKSVAAVSDSFVEEDHHVGVVWVRDAATGKERYRLRHLLLVRCVAFSPDGKTVATGSGGTSTGPSRRCSSGTPARANCGETWKPRTRWPWRSPSPRTARPWAPSCRSARPGPR
jgi:WD40 repeat protein